MDAHNICSTAIVGEVLEGQENYANWRACIHKYLWVRDLWYGVVVAGPSEHPENSEPNWWKRNVSALHAIQISCAPSMLSYIIDTTTAKDAWNALFQKCQDEDEDEDEYEDAEEQHEDEHEQVAEYADRTYALAFLKSINRNAVRAVGFHLTVNPHLSKPIGPCFNPLRVAIMLGNLEMIDALLGQMSVEDVKMQDDRDRTPLHFAAMCPGQTKIAGRLIEKCNELLTIKDRHEEIPLYYACASGHKDMTSYLYKMTTPAYLIREENQSTHAARVISCCVESNLLDVAVDLLRRCPKLAITRFNDEHFNAVIALSLQPSFFPSGSQLSFWQRLIYYCLNVKQSEALFSEDEVHVDIHEQQDRKETKNFMMQGKEKLVGLWSNLLKFFGIKQIFDLKLTHVYAVELLLSMSKMIAGLEDKQIPQSLVYEAIINASRLGITEFIVEIIKNNPDFLNTIDSGERNIFDIAIACRQEKVLNLIYGHEAMKYYFSNFVDEEGNSMLHLAANLETDSKLKLNKISGAALQMQRELQWFKEVESIMPPAMKHSKNKEGKTPYEAFDGSHAELAKEGEQWIKGIAQSSTIVGSLIITIMFAALFTIPGGNNQETGIPLLLTIKLFKVFIISDAVSLFASSTSVLIFVGLLTSRYSKEDFLASLPKKLIIGLLALFISIAAMMVAFCSTVFIMLKGQMEILIPIIFLAAIPICIFVWLQFPLIVTVFMSTYGPGIFDRNMKKWL